MRLLGYLDEAHAELRALCAHARAIGCVWSRPPNTLEGRCAEFFRVRRVDDRRGHNLAVEHAPVRRLGAYRSSVQGPVAIARALLRFACDAEIPERRSSRAPALARARRLRDNRSSAADNQDRNPQHVAHDPIVYRVAPLSLGVP
jgi:hypothetical protein